MPALLIDEDELDPHDIAYYDDVPEFRKERRESHSYGKELKTAALRPYKVWRDNFLQDRCIEKSALVPELLVACTPHILLNILLLGYIFAGAYFLHWIDESVNKQNMREAVLFAYTTITTIGYGNVYPTSQIGKIGCMLYCVGGIPLIYLVLSNNGQFLAEAVWILRNSFTSKKISAATKELPLWMTGVLLILHSVIGGLIFSYWIDQMKFIPAVYFSFISIATIGYGDLVPTPENWFQISVIIVYMSTGIVILSTLVGSLSNYLQWIYNIGRPISGSKDIEVWFGGDMLTVEALVTMVADQFGVPPIRLGAVLTDLDEILRVACETEVQEQTENLRKLSKRESTVFQLNPEIRKMLLKYGQEESPTTSLTFGRFNTNKLFRTSSDSNLPGHFSARETSMALQALGVIHHTLKTQRRPGNRSPMASRQASDATQIMKYLLLVALIAAASGFVVLGATPQCDLEWRYYEYTNSCYYQGDFQEFDGAEKACVNLGAHLASVHTNFENSFIQSITESGEKQNQEGMTWIGLKYVNSKWTWTDGTPFTFSYWMKGAPSKPTKYGCAILMQDDYTHQKDVKNFWDSVECKNKERKYVCKKPANY